ncbi:hemerythrin HHE cation binding domain-containing protein [Frankia torreyi]|uniref:Hemerythrin HHE cation binding domain-containing protein n=1 Tax=Frankia torreyi TaxID=1856 RepID=A0A0D8BEQ4_9ACTN|nr:MULTISPECIES: hemerythrin domain-containing protein [Frankia]KJE21877.1 hemerythrin HHE cation binding domain-containing protein [Frankia torreyi]KQM05254.1 hemerythrin HHE cation binding domain-containing protein [Frankia sp. CpI1-P]
MAIKLAERERAQAATLPEDDIVGVLLAQHARIRDLFAAVGMQRGEPRRRAFGELRALLAVHETGEEMVLRPVSRRSAGPDVVRARNHEEKQAAKVLAALEKLDVTGPDFDRQLAALEQAVSDHAEREELEEFPAVRAATSQDERRKLGRQLRAVESLAPTHPHPSTVGSPLAQWAVGPFASLVDRARDALRHR